MSKPRLVSAFLLLLCLLLPAHAADLPKDFTYVSEAVPDAVFDRLRDIAKGLITLDDGSATIDTAGLPITYTERTRFNA